MLTKRLTLALLVATALVAALTAVPRSAGAGDDGEPASLEAVRTDFLPSKHGFAFRNSFSSEDDPAIVRALAGRCGGMAYGSLDFYRLGEVPPGDSRFDDYLLTRSVDSVVANLTKFALWSVSPDETRSALVQGVGQLTRDEEIPRLAEALKRGPVPLGLVRARGMREIGRNHQVVAYALEQKGDTVIVSVYDSCQPLADDVTLEFDIRDAQEPVVEYAGDWVVARWRGFFVERYAPVQPPR